MRIDMPHVTGHLLSDVLFRAARSTLQRFPDCLSTWMREGYHALRRACVSAVRRLTGHSNTWWDARDLRYLSEQFLRDPVDGVDHPARQYLRNWLFAHPNLTLLDIPCGPGVEYEGCQRDHVPVHYTGMDISDSMLTICRRRYPEADIRKGDILAIPLADKAVDVVLCRHILEHLADYRPAVREAMRVARQKVFIVLFRVPTHAERVALGRGAWDNRLDGQEFVAFLRSLGVSFTMTPVPYEQSVPLGIEENVVVEMTLSTGGE